MKHGDHAIAPSYNAQISAESANKIIVRTHLSQCSSDAQSLIPAIEEVTRNLGKKPAQMVVDGGYTNRDNIVECAAQQIDLVGSLPDPKERTAAAMKSLGIAAEFAPSQFRILDQGQRLECPAGCVFAVFAAKSQARRSISAVSGEGRGLPGVWLPAAMLSEESGEGAHGIHPDYRTG